MSVTLGALVRATLNGERLTTVKTPKPKNQMLAFVGLESLFVAFEHF